jgi:glutamine synthetase
LTPVYTRTNHKRSDETRAAGYGSLSIPNPNDKLVKPCYDVRGFLDYFSWLDKMASAMNALGWHLHSFDHEDANGQYEFDSPMPMR